MIDLKFRRNENEAFRLFRPLAFDDRGFFVCDDETLAFSFVCSPIAGWDSQVISTLSFLLRDKYPVGSSLSFSLFSSPDIKEHLFSSDNLRSASMNSVLKETHNTELGFLWGGTSEPIETVQNTRVRNFQVFVTFKLPVSGIDATESEIEKLLAIHRQMEQRINKSPLRPKKMTDADYINITNVMLNWQENAEWRNVRRVEVDDDLPLNKQVLQYDTKVVKKRSGIELQSPRGTTYCSMLTARRLPKNTMIGMAQKWFGDPFSGNGSVNDAFLITANIFYPDQNKTKQGLERKRNHYLKISGERLTQFAPKIKTISQQISDVVEQLDSDEKIVKVSLNAMTFSSSLQSAEDAKTTLQSKMADCGVSMVEEDSYAIPTFINHMLFGCDAESVALSQRYFSMPTNAALAVLPIFGEWSGTGTPMVSLISRSGQIMSFDLFDSTTNFGCMVYAESGSGKSFLTAEIIRSYLSTGSSVWAIDAGESYKKTAEMLDGNFIAFNEDQDLSLNMFTMIDSEDEESFNESVEMLAGAILAMTFVEDRPSDRQQTEVETIITKVWGVHGRNSLIDHVRDACLEYEDERISDIGHQLEPFCSKGRFGKYFNRPHNVEFKGSFNVLELDGLSELPRLKAVVLFMLMIQIGEELHRQFKQDRSRKKLVIIDEAWSMFNDSLAVAEFFEKGFRRWRKLAASGILVTQGIGDLRGSKAGKAIADNAAISLILKQKASAIDEAEKDNLMALPPAGYNMIKKLVTVPGNYSEIFVATNRGMGVGRLIVDPVRMLMYSTNANDNHDIAQAAKSGLSLGQSLISVAQKRGLLRYEMQKPSFIDFEANKVMKAMSLVHELGDIKEILKSGLYEGDPLRLSRRTGFEAEYYLLREKIRLRSFLDSVKSFSQLSELSESLINAKDIYDGF